MKRWDARTWLIGAIFTILCAQSTLLVKLWLNDLAHIEAATSVIADQMADLRAMYTNHNWQDYARWQYQTQVNEAILDAIALEEDDRPRPPNDLFLVPSVKQ